MRYDGRITRSKYEFTQFVVRRGTVSTAAYVAACTCSTNTPEKFAQPLMLMSEVELFDAVTVMFTSRSARSPVTFV